MDKFKGSLSSPVACECVRKALGRPSAGRADVEIVTRPLTDGGDGFCEVLTRGVGDAASLVARAVTGPRGAPVEAPLGFVDVNEVRPRARELLNFPLEARRIAIVEMAAASGLQLLEDQLRDPWRTTSYGTGQLLAAASSDADAILLGIGGSATHDLGLGALTALGLRCVDRRDRDVDPKPVNWSAITGFRSKPQQLPPLRIACDVSSPLLGPQGAARTFGPQKGLMPRDVQRLERETSRVARLLLRHAKANEDLLELPGSGAAGGLGLGLMMFTDATLVPGFELTDRWLGVSEAVEEADLIITGEGRFDQSSLRGKAAGCVCLQASQMNKPCLVVAGEVDPDVRADPRVSSCQFLQITPSSVPRARALARGAELLETTIETWRASAPFKRGAWRDL
jgi:glycerate kinase